MTPTLIESIKVISAEWEENQNRWRRAKADEDASSAYKFKQVEKHLRLANEILKNLELLNHGTKNFMPQNTFFPRQKGRRLNSETIC